MWKTSLVPRRLLTLALGVAFTAGGLMVSVPTTPAEAAYIRCFVGNADTTYRLLPRQGVVRVGVDFTAINRCRDYSLIGWEVGGIPDTARKLKVSGPGVSQAGRARDGDWLVLDVRFPRVAPGGTRRFRITYEIPNGHPWKWHQFVSRDEYGHLCWSGHPAETGTTKAVFPSRRTPETYLGNVRTKKKGDTVTVTAVRTRNPGTLTICTDVFDTRRQITSRVETEGGGSILIRGWASDPAWSVLVEHSVANVLPRLEKIFGSAISPDRRIRIRQVARRTLSGYAGLHYTSGDIRLGSDNYEKQIVAHEIAHEWSNQRTLAGTWLSEGIADWAANEAARGGVCTRPASYPGKGKPQLSKWSFLEGRSNKRREAIVDYQYDAACYIVTRMAWSIGTLRMEQVIQALIEDRSPYGGSPRTKKEKREPADWREWLDAVDELGMIPAGTDDLRYAERFMVEFGIANPKALKGRSKARAEYHELLARFEPVKAPLVIRDQMDDWRFKTARAAIALASDLGPVVVASQACVGDPDAGPAARLVERYEGARTVNALKRLRRDIRSMPEDALACAQANEAAAEA